MARKLEEANRAHEKLKDDLRAELREKDREISELKRRLDDTEKSLSDKDRQLSVDSRELEQRSQDVERLIGWTEELDQGIWAILGSQRWRVGDFLANLRQRVLLKPPIPTVPPSLKEASEQFHTWKQRRVRISASDSGDATGPSFTVRNRQARKHKFKVSVLSWDMTHNPIGRAYLIADVLSRKFDVEVVGAKFAKYGTEIWEPVRDGTIQTTEFVGGHFPAHFANMEELARQIDGDVIFVSKPRLPSYELGILAKQFRNRPLILDVDDHELSFFKEHEGLTLEEIKERQVDDEFFNPYGRMWTQYCENIIPEADHITVSNLELQKKHGGIVFPHAKDERVFDPALYDRASIRAKFGFSAEDKVILFIGTPRMHKGVVEIAEALEKIGNPKYKLCIIGTVNDRNVSDRLKQLKGDHVRLIPNQSREDLPANLAIGDLVCLLQDPESEIAKYQMPSRFTDALAMEIPILATDAPPLANLASSGLVELLGDAPLDQKIDEIFSDYEAVKRRAVENRKVFLAEYSYAATAPKIERIILSLLEDTPPVASEFERLLEFHRNVFAPLQSGNNASDLESHPEAEDFSPPYELVPGRSSVGEQVFGDRYSAEHVDDKYDIVFFWKQNDTGIYGRRQDMLVKYLSKSPKVNQIIHFDYPIPASFLWSLLDLSKKRKVSQSNQIFFQTLLRFLRLKRSEKVKYYTFVHHAPHEPGRLARWFSPRKARYIRYLYNILWKNEIGKRRTIFWVCPRDFYFPNIVKNLKPEFIVADVIDDHRTWFDPDSLQTARLSKNYEEILGMSDLVLSNNQNVQQSMLAYADKVHLVPNASELPDAHGEAPQKKPRELRRLKGPILGYVGNLSTRIDIDLLEHIAASHPDWNLVLIGSVHLSEDILKRLDVFENIYFLGVKKYADVRRYISNFDVGIIPHLDNEMSRSMNPLKLYVYCSMNVPVVTTDIENLDELGDLVYVARSKSDFVEKVELALEKGKTAEPGKEHMELLRENSWEARVETILDLIDKEFHRDSKERSLDSRK